MGIGEGDPTTGEFPRASIVASPARMIADDYGDIVIRIRDGRWAEDRRLLSHEDFPLAIQRELTGAGSLISVEPSPRYGALGPQGAELCLDALNRGEAQRRAVQRTWQNDLVAVNANSLEPGLNGVAQTIDALTQAVTQGQNLPLLSPTVFRAEFVAVVGDLHPHAQRCLRTAEMLSPFLVGGLDASAVIVQYTKAVEIEVRDKLFTPLKQYWDTRQPPDVISGKKDLQRLYGYLFKGGRLELGSSGFAVEEAVKPRWNHDPVAESLRAILQRLPNPEWARNRLGGELLELAATARNPAAHSRIFDGSDLPRVRRLVLGEGEPGLLEMLLRRQ
jgi:hypothetical protein